MHGFHEMRKCCILRVPRIGDENGNRVWVRLLVWHTFCIVCCFFTPPHKKWRGIMLYPPTFECPTVCPSSVRLSVCQRFVPCSNFSTVWPIFFKLCIDIGIGEEWYGIASGLIWFWNNRVMAFDVCQNCFALRFRALTEVPSYRLSSNFAYTLVSERSGMELQVR